MDRLSGFSGCGGVVCWVIWHQLHKSRPPEQATTGGTLSHDGDGFASLFNDLHLSAAQANLRDRAKVGTEQTHIIAPLNGADNSIDHNKMRKKDRILLPRPGEVHDIGAPAL